MIYRNIKKIFFTFYFFYCVFFVLNTSLFAQSGGCQPVVTTTRDGQQVIFDVPTFISWKIFNDTPFTAEWPGQEARKRLIDEWNSNKVIPVQQFPFKIIEDIYALEYGYPKHDSQRIYLVDCGEELLLIDPSYLEFQPMVEENIKKLGYQPSQVKWVLNTHCHIDHAAASYYWRAKGAKIIIHKDDVRSIETGNQITAFYLNAFGLKYFTPSPVDIQLNDADELSLGNKTFLVIHTPGHTPGSSCFLLKHAGKNLLFSEDIVLYHGRFAWMDHPYADWDTYLKSIYKLKYFHYNYEKVSFDLLLPGHGAIVLNNANLDIERTAEIVEDIMKEPDPGKRNTRPVDPFSFFWEKAKLSHK